MDFLKNNDFVKVVHTISPYAFVIVYVRNNETFVRVVNGAGGEMEIHTPLDAYPGVNILSQALGMFEVPVFNEWGKVTKEVQSKIKELYSAALSHAKEIEEKRIAETEKQLSDAAKGQPALEVVKDE